MFPDSWLNLYSKFTVYLNIYYKKKLSGNTGLICTFINSISHLMHWFSTNGINHWSENTIYVISNQKFDSKLCRFRFKNAKISQVKSAI